MVSHTLMATLRGVCRGEPDAIETLAVQFADAVLLEARMQLHDGRIWQGQRDRILRRNMLKRAIRNLAGQTIDAKKARTLARLAARLVDNKARHYAQRMAATSDA